MAHFGAQGSVQVAEGLIQQAQLGLYNQRSGKGHSLLLASADFLDIGPGIICKAYHFKITHPFLSGLLPLHSPEFQTVNYILEHCHMGKQAVGLEYSCNRTLFRRDTGNVLAVQPHAAAVRIQKASYHIEGRSLPAP